MDSAPDRAESPPPEALPLEMSSPRSPINSADGSPGAPISPAARRGTSDGEEGGLPSSPQNNPQSPPPDDDYEEENGRYRRIEDDEMPLSPEALEYLAEAAAAQRMRQSPMHHHSPNYADNMPTSPEFNGEIHSPEMHVPHSPTEGPAGEPHGDRIPEQHGSSPSPHSPVPVSPEEEMQVTESENRIEEDGEIEDEDDDPVPSKVEEKEKPTTLDGLKFKRFSSRISGTRPDEKRLFPRESTARSLLEERPRKRPAQSPSPQERERFNEDHRRQRSPSNENSTYDERPARPPSPKKDQPHTLKQRAEQIAFMGETQAHFIRDEDIVDAVWKALQLEQEQHRLMRGRQFQIEEMHKMAQQEKDLLLSLVNELPPSMQAVFQVTENGVTLSEALPATNGTTANGSAVAASAGPIPAFPFHLPPGMPPPPPGMFPPGFMAAAAGGGLPPFLSGPPPTTFVYSTPNVEGSRPEGDGQPSPPPPIGTDQHPQAQEPQAQPGFLSPDFSKPPPMIPRAASPNALSTSDAPSLMSFVPTPTAPPPPFSTAMTVPPPSIGMAGPPPTMTSSHQPHLPDLSLPPPNFLIPPPQPPPQPSSLGNPVASVAPPLMSIGMPNVGLPPPPVQPSMQSGAGPSVSDLSRTLTNMIAKSVVNQQNQQNRMMSSGRDFQRRPPMGQPTTPNRDGGGQAARFKRREDGGSTPGSFGRSPGSGASPQELDTYGYRGIPAQGMNTPYYNQDVMSEWAQQGGVLIPQPVMVPLRNGRVLINPGFAIPQSFPAQGCFPVMNKGPNGHIHGEGPPQMRKLFIGGLNHETTDEQIRVYFSQWGPVVDSIVIREPNTKQSRGFGFVTFGTFMAAENAMNNRPHHIGGKTVDSKRAIPREQMMPLFHSPMFDYDITPGCKLTITGIHCDFHSVEALRIYFEKFGTLDQVEVLGKPRGVGFVVFEKREDADRCVQYKGGRHFVNDKRIDIRPAPPSHYRSYWRRRAMAPPPLIPLLDHFAALSLQPYPLMAYPQFATPGWSEEESSYGCTTEDESKAYEESEQESTSENSSPEIDSPRKNSA